MTTFPRTEHDAMEAWRLEQQLLNTRRAHSISDPIAAMIFLTACAVGVIEYFKYAQDCGLLECVKRWGL